MKKYQNKSLKDYLMIIRRSHWPDYSVTIDEAFFREYWYPHKYGSKRTNAARETFVNSYFLPKCFDESIVGIDPITESVTYNLLMAGRLYIMCNEDNGSPSLKDQVYGRLSIIDWIRTLDDNELKGKVKPTIVGCIESIRLEDYIDNLGWYQPGDDDFDFCNGESPFDDNQDDNAEDYPEDMPELD